MEELREPEQSGRKLKKRAQKPRPVASTGGDADARNADRSARGPWGAAFLGTVLLWAAFPPVGCWPLAWAAPVPWVWLIRREALPGRRPYAVLALAGFAFWMAALHWLRLPHWATSFGWVGLSLYFAFYLPVFVAVARVAVHRFRMPVLLAAPVVWTGLELARAHLLTGMSMASLAHTQYRWVGLIQASDLAGEHAVSFLVMLAAAAAARCLPCDARRWCVWPVLPAAAVLGAALFYGQARTSCEPGPPGPRIALVQGSIDAKMQYDEGATERIAQEYGTLSQAAVEKDPHLDLIVWPESMFPEPMWTFDAGARRPPEWPVTDAEFRAGLPRRAEQTLSEMKNVARTLGVPLLLGTSTFHFGVDRVQNFDSAAYVARDGKLAGRYDKMHLVMFGEYVPLAEYLPWLQRLTPLPMSATAGQKPAVFELPYGGGSARGETASVAANETARDTQMSRVQPHVCLVAPNICYETVLSHVIRGQVNALAAEGREPDVLINLTNDGWFWGSSELDMHLMCGVFRAVECRKPLLIAANTGFSAWIDGDGRIESQGPRRDKDVIVAEPRLDGRHSWYLAHGDWFAGVCLAVTIAVAAAGCYDSFRRRREVRGVT
jgi:apolipoprotein N-acyltransferase